MKGLSDFTCGKEVGEEFNIPARILCKINFLPCSHGESWALPHLHQSRSGRASRCARGLRSLDVKLWTAFLLMVPLR